MEPEGGVDRRQWVLEAVDQYEVRLLRFAARLLGDEDAARDAVQQAFLQLCGQSAQRLRGRVGPWLFAVCRHYAIDVLRKRETASPGNEVEAADCCDRDARPGRGGGTGRPVSLDQPARGPTSSGPARGPFALVRGF